MCVTPEQNYAFDVGGFLVLEQILSESEINEALEALPDEDLQAEELPGPIERLRDHPELAKVLEEFTFDGYHAEGPPVRIEVDAPTGLVGGGAPREHTRSYLHQNDVRFAQGIVVLWALDDIDKGDGGFVFVPASHNSTIEPPPVLTTDGSDSPLVEQVVLRAGDVFLYVEGLLHGRRPWRSERRLIAFTYASDKAQRPGQTTEDPPDWASELTPEQRAVVAPDGRPDAAPILDSDGDTVTLRGEPGVYHPSIYIRDPDCEIDEAEFYHWDLCGHIVLKGVMDAEWLKAANEAIDQNADRIEVGGDAAKGSNVLAGTGVPSLRGLFELPDPQAEPFRRMLAHAAVVKRLNWMMGSGFMFRNARAICSVKGTSGHGLHSGGDPARPVGTYVVQNGRTYCEAINVAWQLRDVTEADGGFVCIPGSHKARYPITRDMITCDQTMGLVKHVEMTAGDVAIFLAAAQTHGAYPWKSDIDRRVVLMGYVSRNIA